MGRFETRYWKPDPTAMGPRRARAGGTYRTFIPDRLEDVVHRVDARIAADLADAEQAMLALDASTTTQRGPHRLEVLARMLLRAEAVGSSRVEGLVVSPRKLAMAWFDPTLDKAQRAVEIINNIRALEQALQLASSEAHITPATLCSIHTRLLENTRDADIGGVVRTVPNWIGGLTPVVAEFVPPPPEEVPALLADLCAYVSGEDHPALMQAALAHAQFETIHPFADGNGRTGRALLQLVLRRRGVARRFVPPISLVLATWSGPYIEALTKMRVEDADAAFEGTMRWLELVAQATRLACQQARIYEERIEGLTEQWRAQLRSTVGSLRSDAAAWVLIDALPAAPLITAASAAELTGRSRRAIEQAISLLESARVLKKVGGRQRYRLFEARGVFALVIDTERALASPTGDTAREPPSRPVPARPVDKQR
jgi:Fic family protein